MTRPLCFVLMPFGQKPGPSGGLIQFDDVYAGLIAPAVEAAGMEPIRADQETLGGLIHKPMFEWLILCEYAVADLTSANANVFYELGVRHAVLPASTVLVFAEGGGQIPFDVAPLRGLPYHLGPDGRPSNPAADQKALTERLASARRKPVDSPVFQLVEGFPDIQRLKTDVFRERVSYAQGVKKRLAAARGQGPDAVRAVAAQLGELADVEAGVIVDLLLSFRAVKAWKDMIALEERMPEHLRRTVLVQEQLAFALNRDGRGDEAERVLLELLEKRGPSSETYGLLGRVYKDRWEAAVKSGGAAAPGLLRKAIGAYLAGFESDWRDAYPGVNAVTLMELADPPDARRTALIPVVTYAVDRRLAGGKPDYWDFATRLELAVLAGEKHAARTALADALAVVREKWEPETTARNLRLIREARAKRGDVQPWLEGIEGELASAAR